MVETLGVGPRGRSLDYWKSTLEGDERPWDLLLFHLPSMHWVFFLCHEHPPLITGPKPRGQLWWLNFCFVLFTCVMIAHADAITCMCRSKDNLGSWCSPSTSLRQMSLGVSIAQCTPGYCTVYCTHRYSHKLLGILPSSLPSHFPVGYWDCRHKPLKPAFGGFRESNFCRQLLATFLLL